MTSYSNLHNSHKILVAGSSGLLGRNLISALNKAGHSVFRLVRTPAKSSEEISWNPDKGTIDLTRLNGFDAVVNLAGENIASGKWTEDKKDGIRRSRLNATRLLSEALAKLNPRPEVLVNASAIGYYGNRGTEPLSEESPPGVSFLSGVCREWENATQSAEKAGIRVVKLRTGVVLSTQGGALQRMIGPFKMGLGGVLGSGNQYISWISMRDAVAAMAYCILNESIDGPINLVAPNPVTNSEFTQMLGQALSRPAILPVPAFTLKLLMGDMADELLLGGAKVEPKKLLAAGFKFQDPHLPEALRNILN